MPFLVFKWLFVPANGIRITAEEKQNIWIDLKQNADTPAHMMLPANVEVRPGYKYLISNLPFPLLHHHWKCFCWEEVFVACVLFLTLTLKCFTWTALYCFLKGWPLTLCYFHSYAQVHGFLKWELNHLQRKPQSASFYSLPSHVKFDMEVKWDLDITLSLAAETAVMDDVVQRRRKVVREKKTKYKLAWKMYNKSGRK